MTALHRRYDGPLPQDASAPRDADAPWHEQLENRRHDCWEEVRRYGKEALAAKRLFDEIKGMTAYYNWLRYRKNLEHALVVWRTYYDWHRDATVERELERTAAE